MLKSDFIVRHCPMPRKPGPNTKLTPARKELVLDVLRDGNTITEACRVADVDRSTLLYQRNLDPQFDMDVVEAKQYGIDHNVDLLDRALYERGYNGYVEEVCKAHPKTGKMRLVETRLKVSEMAALAYLRAHSVAYRMGAGVEGPAEHAESVDAAIERVRRESREAGTA